MDTKNYISSGEWKFSRHSHWKKSACMHVVLSLMLKFLDAHEEMRRSFTYMMKIKAPITLQEQWVKKDRTQFNIFLDEEHFPYIPKYNSVPFKE